MSIDITQGVSDSTLEEDELMPPDFAEIKAIIELVNGPISKTLEHMQSNQEELRRIVDLLSSRLVKMEERVAIVEKDNSELSKQITEVQENILEDQRKRFRQTIALQGFILGSILVAFLSYIIPVIVQSFHH